MKHVEEKIKELEDFLNIMGKKGASEVAGDEIKQFYRYSYQYMEILKGLKNG